MRHRILLLALLCLGAVCLTVRSFAQALRSVSSFGSGTKLAKIFSLIDSKQNLFAVDSEYVLQPFYDESEEITELRVVPKYFFQDTHPEWIEPDHAPFLSLSSYRKLLAQIGAVKPLGRLMTYGQAAYTTNARSWFLDQYQNGLVRRVVITDLRGCKKQAARIAAFRVVFFRSISGKLESKDALAVLGLAREYRVQIDGKWYWTTEKEFRRLSVGKEVRVKAAGPISDQI